MTGGSDSPAPSTVDALTPYYEDDLVTLYHGDCREILPSLSAGLVLTDPPYGVGVKYGEGFDDKRIDYWDWMRGAVTDMQAAAPVVVFTQRLAALKELTTWDWVGAWTKPTSFGVRVGNSPVVPHWEPIFMYGIHSLGVGTTFTKDVYIFNPVRNAGQHGRASWADDDNDHPVPKPPGLWRTLLDGFGQGGGVVLDPFAGTGTTLRVAKDAGRKVIGIEAEERFCELIVCNVAQEAFDFGEAA